MPENENLWDMKVTVIPTEIGALGTILKGLVNGLEYLEIRGRAETIQTTALLLYRHLQHHNDTIIKTQEDFFINICIPLTLFVRVRKGLLKVCVWEGVGDRTETAIFWPVSVVSFLFSWCSTGGPGAQLSAGWWLSLLHLITNFSGPQLSSMFLYHILSSNSSNLQLQLIRCPKAPSAWCGFTYHISSISVSNSNWN